VARALAGRGDEILILDDLSTGTRDNVEDLLTDGRTELVAGSIMDTTLVEECMGQADACLHLAAAVGVRLVVDQTLDSIRTNALGSDIVISAAARLGRRLLFTSSSEVYGRGEGRPLSELGSRAVGYRMHARRAYASSKMYAESLALSCVRELGSEMVVSRLFNVVGPRQRGTYGMVLPRFVEQAMRGADLTVYGDGSQSRCFLHIADAVPALIGLIESDAAVGEIYNVGSPKAVRIDDLARMVIERTGSSSGIRHVPFDVAYESGFEDLEHRIPDITAVRRILDWEPQRSLEEAIDDTCRELRPTLDTQDSQDPDYVA
jgi:UDP-glucose 4-epimerase